MASRKYKIISPAVDSTTTNPTDCDSTNPTDWKLCFLCQKKDSEKLVCPDNAKNKSKSAYESIAKNIAEFQKIDRVPLDINQDRLDEGGGITETLVSNNAVYHKSCYLKFTSSKLQRAQKRSAEMMLALEEPSAKRTRSSTRTVNSIESVLHEPICFFCDLPGQLHKASTKDLDLHVRECATKLSDTKLLAKLAMSDMHALDAQYHRKCLVSLYNRMRQHSARDDSSLSISVEAVALAELASYIEESMYDENIAPVFKLSELKKIYTERLEELGAETPIKVNSTRLKDRLLGIMPDLRAESQGREVLLAHSRDIGQSLKIACENNCDSNAMVLTKAVQIVRKDMLNKQQKFDGSFSMDCQKKAVPDTLLALVRMVIEGPNIKDQSSDGGRNDIAYVISQLLIFNSIERIHSCDHDSTIRHNASKETPLPIYLGLMVHASTRRRDLVDKLHDLGLSISYDRVLQLSTDLANSVCAQYESEGVVCPPKLKKAVFTTAAVDNIDHNPSSTTAKDSFHGTALSLTNHLSDECQGIERDTLHINTGSRQKTVPQIPPNYTVVSPVALKNKDFTAPSAVGHVRPSGESLPQATEKEHQWLSRVQEMLHKDQLEKEDFISWAAFHAQSLPLNSQVHQKASIALLPLFCENAHSAAMIKHAMTITKLAVQYLNPGQTTVITMDQPLYCLAKQIQWIWPDTLGEEKYVVMLGGLHIEMALLSMLGKWLDGSGWCSAIAQAGIATSGKADALISASHVKRTRYAHQVTVAALYVLRQAAYQNYTKLEGPLCFDEWCESKVREHPQFSYWNTVMELEVLMNQYVRSLREGNFTLYVDVLDKIAPWFFALDHVHYACWLPVHIRDMVTLKTVHPAVFDEFQKGNFVVRRSTRRFSLMALDQSHEQTNKHIKGEGGAVGLTENPAALRRWMLAGPEVARVVAEFDEACVSNGHHHKLTSLRHHEEVHHIQVSFAKDVGALVAVYI